MLKKLLLELSPRQTWALVAFACVGLLGFGAYLQHVVGLEPCPMCIVQRYAMTGITLVALLAVFWHNGWVGYVMTGLGTVIALGTSWFEADQHR